MLAMWVFSFEGTQNLSQSSGRVSRHLWSNLANHLRYPRFALVQCLEVRSGMAQNSSGLLGLRAALVCMVFKHW